MIRRETKLPDLISRDHAIATHFEVLGPEAQLALLNSRLELHPLP
jgi:hypothetical protein